MMRETAIDCKTVRLYGYKREPRKGRVLQQPGSVSVDDYGDDRDNDLNSEPRTLRGQNLRFGTPMASFGRGQ
jgi:hypothetical protein